MRRRTSIAHALLASARKRAKALGLPFALKKQDIVVPQFCPVLGFELTPGVGRSQDHSPTLDRIRPEDGYVPGNVIVISHRANRLKSDASIEELRRIASFYDQLIGKV